MCYMGILKRVGASVGLNIGKLWGIRLVFNLFGFNG
jgi:hypothetical protein